MDRTQVVRDAQRRYYQSHASDVIARKTLRMVRERGRVPRESTLTAHGIPRDVVRAQLLLFAVRHPRTKAAQRIMRTPHAATPPPLGP